MSTNVDDFNTLTGLEFIRKGQSGEKFKLFSNLNSCVVKFEKASPMKSLIGTGVLQRANVTTTPGMKNLNTVQRATLANAAKQLKTSGALHPDDCDSFKKCCKNEKDYASAVIMDLVQGVDVDAALKQPELLIQALTNSTFAENLGRIVAADAFALNSDRFIVRDPKTTDPVLLNKGNLMIGEGGTAVPIDPSFMFPMAHVRPGSTANKSGWGISAHGTAYLRSPSVVTFYKVMASSIPCEGDALFTYFQNLLGHEDKARVESSREAFVKSFMVGALDAATSLLKRRQGWKDYILECGGSKKDTDDFRLHKRLLNQIAQGESIADAAGRAKDVMKYRRWVMTKELEMSEEDAEKIINEEDWNAYKEAKTHSPLNGQSDCFVTTATCVALGRGDECPELHQLRWFRDNVLSNMAGGPEAIALYYRIAPTVVAKIESQPDSRAIFREIYDAGIAPALAAIRAGRHAQAYRIYQRLVLNLMRRCRDSFAGGVDQFVAPSGLGRHGKVPPIS